jgi:formylglycine-generating enzyme
MKLPLTCLTLGLLATPVFAVVNIDWVDVGHAGNAADPATGSLYGAVAYAYKIGQYEVTNAQYTEFLNAVDPTGANANGIYNSSMGSNAAAVSPTLQARPTARNTPSAPAWATSR